MAEAQATRQRPSVFHRLDILLENKKKRKKKKERTLNFSEIFGLNCGPQGLSQRPQQRPDDEL